MSAVAAGARARRAALGAALVGASLLLPARASAQTAPPRDAAEAHFLEGNRLFGLRAYAAAARAFALSYEASHEVTLLFNLGRALEESGDLAGALDAYHRFDAGVPATFDRQPVRARIEGVERRLAAARSRATPAVAARPSPPAPPGGARSDRPGRDGGFPAPPAGALALLVGGGAVVGAGAVLGALANAALDGCRVDGDVARCPTEADLDRARQAPGFATAANVSFAVGAAALAAGAVWWALAPTRRVRIAAGPGAVSVTLRW